MRFLATFFVLAALACGGQEGDTGVSAPGDTGSGRAADTGGSTVSATGQRCLDLVAQGRFSDAVDPCTRAVREAPESQELAAALEQAQGGVAASAEEARQAAEDAQAQADALEKTGEAFQR